MTVERLIKQLEKYNPKAEVKMHDRLGLPVLFALAIKGDEDTVWLECENDCDLGSELDARFQNLREKQLDPIKFYTDLLEMGIDVDTVCKYMGKYVAEDMRNFCKERGLM